MQNSNIRYVPADPSNFGSFRSAGDIQYIVIHYTGNDGDTAIANARYFQRKNLQTSAHYFVDSTEVVQSVPDLRIAWHCGSKHYLHPDCRNRNSIGVELCDDLQGGVIYPTPATIYRALVLVGALMAEYHIPADHVIRHYDVSGKLCPAYWCGTPALDVLWESAFHGRLISPEEGDDDVTRYQTLDDVSAAAPWAVPTIEKLLAMDALRGTGDGFDLSDDMLRLLVISDRAGAFD